MAIADGVCRQVSILPSSTEVLYGAALCDSSAGRVYVRAPFATSEECVLAVGAKDQLIQDPYTVVFGLSTSSAVLQCVASQQGSVVEYYQLSTQCITISGGSGSVPGRESKTVTPRAYTNSPFVMALLEQEEGDDGVPGWMVVVLTVLLIALTVVCVVFILRKARVVSLPEADDEDAPAAVKAMPDDHLVPVDFSARPAGPPTHAMHELNANSVVNPSIYNKASQFGTPQQALYQENGSPLTMGNPIQNTFH